MATCPVIEPLERFLPYQLSVASNAVSARIAEQYRKRFALKTTQWRVMAVLGDSGPMTQRDLSRATLMDKVPVNRACSALEARGLIVRAPNQRDGRSHLLALTEAGQAVHAGIMPLAVKIEEELFSVLTAAERDLMREMLTRVRANAGEFDPESLADD